jgi:DNA polymerase III subunit alpha
LQLEDREGAVECIAWPETYQKYESTIAGDEPVVVKGKLDVGDERAQIILDEIRPLGAALTEAVREVRIRAGRDLIANGELERIKELLQRHRGQSLIYLHLDLEDGQQAIFLLGDSYRVAPTEGFVAELENMLMPGSVELR